MKISYIVIDMKNIEEFMANARIPARLACINRDNWPVVLSLWYIKENGKIYFATQETAKVVEYLKNNSKCSVEIATEQPPYKGVRIQGNARIDKEKGEEILKKLFERYNVKTDSKLYEYLMRNIEKEVAIELTIEKTFTWDFTERMEEAINTQRSEC